MTVEINTESGIRAARHGQRESRKGSVYSGRVSSSNSNMRGEADDIVLYDRLVSEGSVAEDGEVMMQSSTGQHVQGLFQMADRTRCNCIPSQPTPVFKCVGRTHLMIEPFIPPSVPPKPIPLADSPVPLGTSNLPTHQLHLPSFPSFPQLNRTYLRYLPSLPSGNVAPLLSHGKFLSLFHSAPYPIGKGGLGLTPSMASSTIMTTMIRTRPRRWRDARRTGRGRGERCEVSSVIGGPSGLGNVTRMVVQLDGGDRRKWVDG